MSKKDPTAPERSKRYFKRLTADGIAFVKVRIPNTPESRKKIHAYAAKLRKDA